MRQQTLSRDCSFVEVMDEERRKQRARRMRNRLRIGYILLALSLVLGIITWFITGYFVLYAFFLVPVGAAYLIAGLWERRELKGP